MPKEVAEIERLANQIEAESTVSSMYFDQITALQAKCERMEAALVSIRDNYPQHADDDYDNRLYRVRHVARAVLTEQKK
jgi:hypothetical protein